MIYNHLSKRSKGKGITQKLKFDIMQFSDVEKCIFWCSLHKFPNIWLIFEARNTTKDTFKMKKNLNRLTNALFANDILIFTITHMMNLLMSLVYCPALLYLDTFENFL